MILNMRNVAFSWDSKSKALLNFDEFSIQEGERILIRGSSGSGKSTLLNLIGGLLVPQSGHINMLGTDIETLSSAQRDRFRSHHIGFIFQTFNLIPYLNVLENVLLPLEFSQHKRSKLSQAPKEEALRLLKALGIDELSEKKVHNLSIGQQQRVAVARALIGNPELVIADEPTSALDTDSREQFLNLLFKECEKSKSSLLYVSHDPGLEKYFDRTIPISHFTRTHA